ncbi:MAG: single-stranded DNA-binding protein [Clostridiales bacterium]|nr:single-stranded DNA-binding protein [Clostridiales bacterium]
MNYEMMNNNIATISGIVIEEPRYSHQMYGEGFYESTLSVPRLSEQVDNIPFTISERLLTDNRVSVGNTITLSGQLRSYNKIIDGRSKLLLTLFVRDILDEEEGRNPNTIDLVGYICKPPIYRLTPFKREISDILLAVNRAYNKSDYLPCIAWGRNARFIKDIDVGQKVYINGRIQSREYQKQLENGDIETRTAYEVSINRIGFEQEYNSMDGDF